MKTDLTILAPSGAASSERRGRLAPPVSLDGKIVALLDIGKMRGNEFIDELERQFVSQGHAVRRYAKPTNVKVAPVDLIQQIVAECDVVVEALADCGSCTSCAVHDINQLDQLGVPGGLVATVEFQDAEAAQSGALGFAPGVVWVEHPIQNKTTEELHDMAKRAFEGIFQLVTK